MSKSSTKSSQAQKQSGASGPWAYATPAIQGFTDKLSTAGGIGMTPDQSAAFGVLKNNAAQGNPWTAKQAGLADQAYNTADRSGMVGSQFNAMQTNLGNYANGSMNDPASNPYLSKYMDQVGTQAFDKINAQFAGAGRDLSGINQKAAAAGYTEASLPLAFNQYNQGVANQFSANNALMGGAQSTATTQGALDQQRLGMQAQAGALGQQALDMRNSGANQVLNLDQQIKQMPYEDLSQLAALLFPAAGLGGVTTGTGQGNSQSKTSGFNLGSLIGGMG
ncbi:hypothetical protein [Sphingorhabdus sp.]|uniref:hypothetical protein n=1 Tax=Sphingorhabdus sp. TaxID=1902408 RepID=UPI002FDE85FC